jgi:hypothetical protein
MPAPLFSAFVAPDVMYCDTVAAFTRFLFPVLSAKIHSAHFLGRPVIHRLYPTPCNKQDKQQTRFLHAFRLSAISARIERVRPSHRADARSISFSLQMLTSFEFHVVASRQFPNCPRAISDRPGGIGIF